MMAQTTSGGRPIAWTIGGGFIPSFGEQGKIKRKFQFSPSAARMPKPFGLRPSVLLPYPASKGALENNLKKKLFAAGARYSIRGNYTWWQNGVDNLDIKAIAESLFDVFDESTTTGIAEIDARIKETKLLKGDTKSLTEEKRDFKSLKMEELFNNIFQGYRNMETDLAKRVQGMIGTMIDHQFKGKDLENFVDTYWQENGKLLADVSEEEWKMLNESTLLSGKAGFEEPGETIGDAEKIDMKGWIMRNGKKINLAFDVTEDFLTTSEAVKSGVHGLGKAITWGGKTGAAATDYSWIGENRATVRNAIAKHFDSEIEEFFNPIVKDIKAHLKEDTSIPGNTIREKMENYVPKYMPNQDWASLTSDIKSGTILANTKTAALLNEWVNEETGYIVGRDPATAKGQKAIAKKKGKLLGYVQHNMKNIHNMVETEFSQMHRVSKKSEIGDAWYASIPMSLFPEGDENEFEFKRKGARTPLGSGGQDPMTGETAEGGTVLLHGPRASLALLIKEGVINDVQARVMQARQSQVFAVGHMHAGTSTNDANGATMSLCNGYTAKGNHGTTVAYTPKVLLKFFTDFVKTLETGDKVKADEFIIKAADKALTENTVQVQNRDLGNFNRFWALPFIGIEDNLERLATDLYSWYNKGLESKGDWKTGHN